MKNLFSFSKFFKMCGTKNTINEKGILEILNEKTAIALKANQKNIPKPKIFSRVIKCLS